MKNVLLMGLLLIISLAALLLPVHYVNAQSTTLKIDTVFLPDGKENIPYRQSFEASDGTVPYTWAITDGTLPVGLMLDRLTGVISGIPTSPGPTAFKVTVTDSVNNSSTKTLYITINTDIIQALNITLAGADVGVTYKKILNVFGGKAPYTWSVTDGTLPNGLTLDSINGIIDGTPTTSGIFSFDMTVKDSLVSSTSQTLTVTIAEAPDITTVSPLSSGDVGLPYDQTLAVSGSTPPHIWTLSDGSLPDGLWLDRSNGQIRGTPTTTGATSFTVTVKDGAGGTSSKALNITIVEAPNITTLPNLARGDVDVAYSQTLTVSGGVAPYTWALAGDPLPDGLFLNADTGVISGIPTFAGGPTSFEIIVKDSVGGTARKMLAVTIMTRISTAGLNSDSIVIIDSKGYIHGNSQFKTTDNKTTLDIADMTGCWDHQGQPLTVWEAILTPSPVKSPSGNAVILAHSFGPHGAKFQPPLNLTLKYDPKIIPAGVSENTLCIAWWNGRMWQIYFGVVDTTQNTISTQISHFGTFSTPITTSTPPLISNTAPPAHWEIVIGLMVAILMIISILFVILTRRRSSKEPSR